MNLHGGGRMKELFESLVVVGVCPPGLADKVHEVKEKIAGTTRWCWSGELSSRVGEGENSLRVVYQQTHYAHRLDFFQ